MNDQQHILIQMMGIQDCLNNAKSLRSRIKARVQPWKDYRKMLARMILDLKKDLRQRAPALDREHKLQFCFHVTGSFTKDPDKTLTKILK